MVVAGLLSDEITIPKGVSVKLDQGVFTFSGKEGSVTKRFDLGRMNIEVGGSIKLSLEAPNRREYATFNTITSEIRSTIYGVQNGYDYRLKIVYAHFPIKVQVKGDRVVIENFLGERYPRYAKILPGAKVTVEHDTVVVRSADLDAAGQTAANIERATRIKDYDKRVFQDGIYIIEKAGKVLVA